jgi:hypothetical protein
VLAIPVTYRESLRKRAAGVEIAIRIQLFGKDPDGDEVETQEFDFPVTICDGCLTECGDLASPSARPGEFSDEDRARMPCDNAGADGRICIGFCY